MTTDPISSEAAPARGSLPPVALFDNFWAPTLAFAISLGRRGVPLHVYGRGAARWSRYCAARRACPPIEEADRFLPWLRERIRSGEITRIAPTTDLLAYYLSELRDEFPPEVQRSIAPLREIETALIKSRFSAACEQAGQLVPATRTPDGLEAAIAAARELEYPLVLKPKSHIVVGSAERGGVIHDEAALRANFQPYAVTPGQGELGERYPELRWPLLQRYLPAARRRVYSVTGFKDPDTGIVTAGLSYKREQWPADIGTSTLQISSRERPVLDVGLRAIDRLVSRGIFELELVADDGQLLAIDWNPRAFGFINLDIAAGRDLPWLWLVSTLGPVAPIGTPDPGIALEARHVLLHVLRKLSQGRTGRAERLRVERRDPERPRDWVSILGQWSDPLPLMLAHAKLLQHPRSLIRTHLVSRRVERARRAALECAPP